ncbi:unnamed protein product [Prorocentrum cordatum]|uniref:Uncharacterized protein n=1 Tax=Prorocentrum cordatum TaxID=2364126 RepID=A0ABN9TYK2_9DINO|nr:unnamed protein product [Polarella glacialis]
MIGQGGRGCKSGPTSMGTLLVTGLEWLWPSVPTAVASPLLTSSGNARVYESAGGAWQQVGSDISGAAGAGGYQFSLSADGGRVAMGDTNGMMRVFGWASGTWQQMGADIYIYGGFAVAPAFNADGSRVAAGAPYCSTGGFRFGCVRVYDWVGGAWQKVGSDITGTQLNERTGVSVSLSANGSRVAVPGYYYDDSRGRVRVFDWEGDAWVQAGSAVAGDASWDQFGLAVSLSADGTRLAVGAFPQQHRSQRSRYVRIYDWADNAWQQVESFSNVGSSVSLSSDGTSLAVGTPGWAPIVRVVRIYGLGSADPTPSPTPSSVQGTGDPHLVNIYGEHFDIYQPGAYVLLQVPRGASLDATRLLVKASVEQLGAACGEMHSEGQHLGRLDAPPSVGPRLDRGLHRARPRQVEHLSQHTREGGPRAYPGWHEVFECLRAGT